jgi:hypothetical protein
MRRTAVLALGLGLLGFLSGCGQAPAPVEAPEPTVLAATPDANFPVPNSNPVGDLGLLVPSERSDARIRVGDSADEFRTILPRPASVPRSLQDLPPQIPPNTKGYAVWGWEYDDRSRGAGALLYEDRVTVAMRQLESLQPSEIEQVLASYNKTFGIPREIEGPKVHYWFWQSTNVTLMLCTYRTGQGGQNLTEAVGDSAVMAALGMSPDRANAQKEIVGRIFHAPPQPEDVTNPG